MLVLNEDRFLLQRTLFYSSQRRKRTTANDERIECGFEILAAS